MNGQLIDGFRRVVVKKRLAEIVQKRLSKDILTTVDNLNDVSPCLMSNVDREDILKFDFLLDKIIVQCSLVARGPIDIEVFARALGVKKFRVLDSIEDSPSLYSQYCDTTHKMFLLNRGVSCGFNEERLTQILEKALTDSTWSWRKLSTLARMCDCDEQKMYAFLKSQPKVYEFSDGSFGHWIIRLLVKRRLPRQEDDSLPRQEDDSPEVSPGGDVDSSDCGDEATRGVNTGGPRSIAATWAVETGSFSVYTFETE